MGNKGMFKIKKKKNTITHMTQQGAPQAALNSPPASFWAHQVQNLKLPSTQRRDATSHQISHPALLLC